MHSNRGWRVEHGVALVLDFFVGQDLGSMRRQVLLEIAVIVDGGDSLTHAPRLRRSIARRVLEGVDDDAVAEQELLVEGSKLLHLQRQACIHLIHDVAKALDGFGARRRDQLSLFRL